MSDTSLFYTNKAPKSKTGIRNIASEGSLERLDLLESRFEEIFPISCILFSPKNAKLAFWGATKTDNFYTALQECGALNGG